MLSFDVGRLCVWTVRLVFMCTSELRLKRHAKKGLNFSTHPPPFVLTNQNIPKKKDQNQRYPTTTTTTINHQSTSHQADNSPSMPLSSWQQCQSRFTASRNSLLSEESISSQVEQHMQLPASSPSSEPSSSSQMMLSAFLPMQTTSVRRMSSNSISSLPQQQQQQHRGRSAQNNVMGSSLLGLPMVPLRRDHSTDGGQCHRDMLL